MPNMTEGTELGIGLLFLLLLYIVHLLLGCQYFVMCYRFEAAYPAHIFKETFPERRVYQSIDLGFQRFGVQNPDTLLALGILGICSIL